MGKMVELLFLNNNYCWQPEDVPLSPVAQKLFVFEQENENVVPCMRKTHRPQNRFFFVVILLAHLICLHLAQIIVFSHFDRPKCHPCPGKTHDSRFAIFGSPNYLALAHGITTLEKYFLHVHPVQ